MRSSETVSAPFRETALWMDGTSIRACVESCRPVAAERAVKE